MLAQHAFEAMMAAYPRDWTVFALRPHESPDGPAEWCTRCTDSVAKLEGDLASLGRSSGTLSTLP